MSSSPSYWLFETPLGTAAVAWTACGLAGVELPSPDPARIRGRMRRRFPHGSEAPAEEPIATCIRQIVALLGGEHADFSDIVLDTAGLPDFDLRVYALARTIAAGQTMTYGDIARGLGDVHLARDVGQALARNPFPIVVPCHRVIAANGRLGGFSAAGGVTTKQRLLDIEQASGAWQLPLGLPR
jgi:methylated-DNA-[protein]-cysteine S-methyltransferase